MNLASASTRAGMVALAALAALAPIGSAAGQSTRYPPTPRDYDDAHERRSSFWDKIIDPDQTAYQQLIARARDHLQGRDAESLRQAERRLLEATRLLPDEPDAFWMLGLLYESDDKWQECVDAFGQVARLAPAYEPDENHLPVRRGASWALDFGLATCHAQLGAFEQAIAHYQRILQRGATQDARVYRGLGEAYMALGRLHEAIGAFDIARKRDSGQWHIYYPLAVAYDRAEQGSQAREALEKALLHDPAIKSLEGPGLSYAPPSERLYYLALAHAVAGQPARAIAYFRHYAELEPGGLWAHRVEAHLRDLGRIALPAPESITASDKALDLDTLAAIIGRARDPLHACLADTPDLLVEVRITVLGATDSHRPACHGRTRPPPPPGVKAQAVYAFSATDDQQTQAIECVEARAADLRIPRVRGDTAPYRTITFPLIAPR